MIIVSRLNILLKSYQTQKQLIYIIRKYLGNRLIGIES